MALLNFVNYSSFTKTQKEFKTIHTTCITDIITCDLKCLLKKPASSGCDKKG